MSELKEVTGVCTNTHSDDAEPEPVRSFFEVDGEGVHLLDSLLQLVLGRGRDRIDLVVAAVVVVNGVSGIHDDLESKNQVRTWKNEMTKKK